MIVDGDTPRAKQVPDFKWCREPGAPGCDGLDLSFQGLMKAA
jgi:hypothetical protein